MTTARRDADAEEAGGDPVVDRVGQRHGLQADEPLGGRAEDDRPRRELVGPEVTAQLDGQGGRADGDDGADDERDDGGADRRLVGGRSEQVALGEQEEEDEQRQQQPAEAGAVGKVEDERGREQANRDDPRPPLATQHATGEHHQPDPGQRDERAGGLGDAERHVLTDEVQVAGRRPADGDEQVEEAGEEDGGGGEPPDASDADAVGRDVWRGRPRRATRPRRDEGRMQVSGGLAALDDVVAGGDPFERRRRRQVDVGEQQPDVQVGTGLELDPARLAVVEEDGRQADAAAVLADQLGRAAGAGEEAGAEMRELGP